MARGDVTTRSNRGQWENAVEDMPERSESFRSREEAVEAGRALALALALGTAHVVVPSEPEGTITDPEPRRATDAR